MISNRLTKQVTSETGGAHYTYRADGMRTQKVTDCSYSWYYDEINDSSFYDEVTTVNKPTTRYFYAGQMACEEDFAEIVPNEDPFFEVTRYGLGARGVDWIEKATIEDTSISFPIYDGHGNVIAQLGRTGSSYSLTQVKSYDVWGGVRSGALGPAGRYCGNLGHVSDDESGLIYMRARYYEPGSGRFISEDPAMDGLNWFAYCGNDPVNCVDADGQRIRPANIVGSALWLYGLFQYSGGYLACLAMNYASPAHRAELAVMATMRMTKAVQFFTMALAGGTVNEELGLGIAIVTASGWFKGLVGTILGGLSRGSTGHGAIAVSAVALYSLMILGALIASMVEP